MGLNDIGPRLLHLGCGLKCPEEWINVDGSRNAWLAQHPVIKRLVTAFHLAPRSQTDIPWPTNVVVSDLRKTLPFASGSFDAVFSSHLVEHLHRDEARALLKEAHRVLKPGGICRTLVPDLMHQVRQYLDASAAPRNETKDPARELVDIMHLRSDQAPRRNSLYRFFVASTDFHIHKWMYDAPSLARLMTEAGFVDCVPRKYLESTIPFLDKVEKADRADGGAIVEGIKR